MNVISRILGALVALALAKIGQWLGLEFTETDVQTVTMWMVAGFTVLYGIAHPLIRSRLVALTGRGARQTVAPAVTDPTPITPIRPPDPPRAA